MNETRLGQRARRDERSRDLGHAVELHHVVQALRSYGLTQEDIAQTAGVSDRTVRAWEKGQPLRRRHEEAIQDLREIVLIVSPSLTKRGVGQWFRARNRVLGGRRPLEAFAEGDIDDVRSAAEGFADGAYV